jgi:hypothetical protein
MQQDNVIIYGRLKKKMFLGNIGRKSFHCYETINIQYIQGNKRKSFS